MITLPAKSRGSFTAARPIRSALAVLFAVAMVAGLASFAQASCGDWLANPDPSMASHAATPAAQQASGKGQTLATKSHLPAPCNGPICGKAPDAPSPAVPATVLDRMDRISIALHAADGDLASGRFGFSSDWDARPLKGFPSRLEHPPRA
jgi:hypothetical protein